MKQASRHAAGSPARRATRALPCLLAALLAMLPVAPARAGQDPARRWRTVETPHFRIHHHQGGEAMARRAAAIAEEARDRVGRMLGLQPSQVVEMSVWDDTDAANGWASVLPYDRIRLFAAPPGPDSELAAFDDHLRALVYHEYTHILHMDHVSGVPGLVNRVLGKTLLPNGATHPWFIEGLAVLVESRLTGGGRLGSSLYAMQMRMAALEDTFPDLSELTVAPLELPRGGAPYLYGGYFLDFLYARFGADAIAGFVRDYGARLIPFAMNVLARRHFGRDFMDLWRAFRDEETARARATATRVEALGRIEGVPLTSDGETNVRPVFRDADRLVWVRSDARSMPGLFQVDLSPGADPAPRRLADCDGGCGTVASHRDRLFTTSSAPTRLVASHGEVFELDPVRGMTRRTRQARARDLAIAADGTWLYVATGSGQVSLVARRPDGPPVDVVPAGRFADLGDPRPIPGTDRVAFTAAQDGRWDLWTVARDGSDLRRLTDDACLDRDPAASPDGRWLVWSTDPGGIFDLFALDLATGARRRVTRALGGAFWPAVSPDGRRLAFVTWNARGHDLALLPFDPASWPAADPSEACPRSDPRDAWIAPSADGPSRPYRPVSMRPRALMPRWAFSSGADARLGFEVTGADALDRHAFSVAFDADVRRFEPYASLHYAYGGLFPDLSVGLSTWHGDDLAVVDDRLHSVDSRHWMLNGTASLAIPGRVVSFDVSLGYAIRWKLAGRGPAGHEPASTTPWRPRDRRIAGVTAAASFRWLRSYARSISTERGLAGGLSLGTRQPWLGGDGSAWTMSGHLYGYVPMPWRRGHVLAVLASGALSRGDPGTADGFSVGGFPPQDLVLALVNREPLGGRHLRGFATGAFRGDTYALANVEYRFPIVPIFRGPDTLPMAARHLWGTVFADGGGAWNGTPRTFDVLHWDVGAELALSVNLFLGLDATVRLGYAHGFGRRGGDVVYFLLSP